MSERRRVLVQAKQALRKFGWDEGKHPRHPKGAGDQGGEFAPAGGAKIIDLGNGTFGVKRDGQSIGYVKKGISPRWTMQRRGGASFWRVSMDGQRWSNAGRTRTSAVEALEKVAAGEWHFDAVSGALIAARKPT